MELLEGSEPDVQDSSDMARSGLKGVNGSVGGLSAGPHVLPPVALRPPGVIGEGYPRKLKARPKPATIQEDEDLSRRKTHFLLCCRAWLCTRYVTTCVQGLFLRLLGQKTQRKVQIRAAVLQQELQCCAVNSNRYRRKRPLPYQIEATTMSPCAKTRCEVTQ